MLLAARKHPVLEHLYAGYGRRLLRAAFARVWVGGADWPDEDRPVIAYANHSAWWDPVLAVHLSHDVFRRDGYGLMDGTQLVRYPFFRHLGCFGVVDEGRGGGELAIEDARAVGEYATAVLRGGRGRVLWLFPQGALLPSRLPLRFRSGLARISRGVPEARLVPIAMRYEFRGRSHPECFIRIGEAASPAALTGASALLTRRLERVLADELAALDADLLADGDPAALGYRPVLAQTEIVSRVYDRTLGQLLRHVGP